MPVQYFHSPFQTFINIVTLIAFIFGVAAFGISVRSLLQALDNRDDISALETEACFSDLQCVNATLGNQCLNAFCGSNGLCQTNLTSGAECAFSSQCMEGFCNEECMCQPQCSSDIECARETLGNPCLEASCVNATCEVELLPGAMCAFSTSCSSGFCNDQCMCSTVNGTIQCSDDLQCVNATLGNPCLDAFCVNGACQTNLTGGAECAFSTQCSGGGSVCNDQCMCESVNGTSVECTSTLDCLVFNASSCMEYQCVDNKCGLFLSSGSTCSDASPCSSGQFCNSTCQCETISTSGFECSVDEDCPSVSNNMCEEFVCLGNGTCDLQTISGMNCSSSQECGSNEVCDNTCNCVGISSTATTPWLEITSYPSGNTLFPNSGTPYQLNLTTFTSGGPSFAIMGSSTSLNFTEDGTYRVDYSVVTGIPGGGTAPSVVRMVPILNSLRTTGGSESSMTNTGDTITFGRQFITTAVNGDVLTFNFEVGLNDAVIRGLDLPDDGYDGFIVQLMKIE